MANLKESKLQIIRDLPRIPTNIRFARVTSPLLDFEEARIEARRFVRQYQPDNLSCEDVVEITDSKGHTIGGAIIWEASWVKESDTQEEDPLLILREALQEEQMDQPPGQYLIN